MLLMFAYITNGAIDDDRSYENYKVQYFVAWDMLWIIWKLLGRFGSDYFYYWFTFEKVRTV